MPKRSGEAIDKHIGGRIKLRRSLRGLNLKDLGDALGVSTQQVQKYEAGDNRVAAGQLFHLSRVLGVEIGYFFEGWKDPSENDVLREDASVTWDAPFDAYGRQLNNLVQTIESQMARDALLQSARAFASYEQKVTVER